MGDEKRELRNHSQLSILNLGDGGRIATGALRPRNDRGGAGVRRKRNGTWAVPYIARNDRGGMENGFRPSGLTPSGRNDRGGTGVRFWGG